MNPNSTPGTMYRDITFEDKREKGDEYFERNGHREWKPILAGFGLPYAPCDFIWNSYRRPVQPSAGLVFSPESPRSDAPGLSAPPAPATAQAEPSGDEWKPIETAPKNGTEFIGLSGDELAICSWEPLDNPVAKHWGIAGTWHRKAVASGKDLMGTFSPTHWTRLPGRDAIKAAMGRGR